MAQMLREAAALAAATHRGRPAVPPTRRPRRRSPPPRGAAAARYHVPEHLAEPYVLRRVYTHAECARIIDAVHQHTSGHGHGGGGWSSGRHGAYPTNDIPVSAIVSIAGWINQTLKDRVLPVLAERHCGQVRSRRLQDGSHRQPIGADGGSWPLRIRDLFLVRYSCPAVASGADGAAVGLQSHRDASAVSFNILLNPSADFDGGGTFFVPDGAGEADDRVIRTIDLGDCLVHAGKQRHGGQPITRGERFILVGFIDGEVDV